MRDEPVNCSRWREWGGVSWPEDVYRFEESFPQSYWNNDEYARTVIPRLDERSAGEVVPNYGFRVSVQLAPGSSDWVPCSSSPSRSSPDWDEAMSVISRQDGGTGAYQMKIYTYIPILFKIFIQVFSNSANLASWGTEHQEEPELEIWLRQAHLLRIPIVVLQTRFWIVLGLIHKTQTWVHQERNAFTERLETRFLSVETWRT